MMIWTTVNTSHASGDAKSAFSSLPAMVKIMTELGSLVVFASREIDEHVLQARLRRLQAIQAPVRLHRALDEDVARGAVSGKLHAKQRGFDAFGGSDAGHRGDIRHGRRPAQPDERGRAGLELLQRGDRVAVND